MPVFFRWFKRVVAAAIVLLWLVVVIAFIRSKFVQDMVEWTDASGTRLRRVHVKENGIVVASISGWREAQALSWRHGRGAPQFGIPMMWDGAKVKRESILPGISRDSGPGQRPVYWEDWSGPAQTGMYAWDIVIIWPVFLLITTPPAAFILWRSIRRRIVRRMRRQRGLCLECGYDLRAATDRCPECGAATIGTTTPAITPPDAVRS